MTNDEINPKSFMLCHSLQIGEQRWLRFLIGKCFGALLASFHDEFVQRRVEGQGIIALKQAKQNS